jgi:hypothetical protein
MGAELLGCIIAAVLVMCVMWWCLPRGEGFLATAYYAPACGSVWSGRDRAECHGITTGVMPSIDTTNKYGSRLCAGRLGVPP